MLDSDRDHIEADREGVRWAVPVLVLGAVLVIGGMIYAMSGDQTTTTASNDGRTITNSGPAPAGAPVPGPTSTTPAPNR
jgi:hypothetical protein